MQQAKEYDYASSNLANFGTELETNIKKHAAEGEKAWANIKDFVGTKMWRVVNFKLETIPAGTKSLYNGDSYIVYHGYKKENKILADVHFWLGKHTTADEAGTAAYKVVELDTLLDDVPVQHREVSGYESALFKSYFPEGLFIMDGGADSGFNHVEAEEYRPRLLQIKGKKRVKVFEVPISAASLNSGDCFILDCGLTLYQWNGSKASIREKAKAASLARALDDERSGKAEIEVNDEGQEEDSFWEKIGGKGEVAPAEEGSDDAEKPHRKLHKLSDASGKLEFTEVACEKGNLSSDDAFIFDVGAEVFVWIGKGASKSEKENALYYAQEYLNETGRPAYLPISKIYEGGENEVFENHWQ